MTIQNLLKNCKLHAICILTVLIQVHVLCEKTSPECDSWSEIEQDLNRKSEVKLSCIKNSFCTGINCTGTLSGYNFQGGMEINPCSKPNTFDLFIDIPDLKIRHWRRSFSHGDTFELSDIKGELELKKDNGMFIIGLSAKITVSTPKILPSFKTPVSIPLLREVSIPVPSCRDEQILTTNVQHIVQSANSESKEEMSHALSKISAVIYTSKNHMGLKGNCSISESACQKNEICQQINKSSTEGICICNSGYHRDVNHGHCAPIPTQQTTTEMPFSRPVSPKNSPDSSTSDMPFNGSASPQSPAESGTSMSLLLTAILVPLAVIIVIVIIVYVSIRLRVCQALRRRLRVQVYEQVLLGQDDEDEEQLTDPVA